MYKIFLAIGSISAALAVALGAFGAHGLEGKLTERYMEIYQTGVQYHMIHSLGLILVGIISAKILNSKLINVAGWCLFGGIIIFSGSLYILSMTGFTMLGMITPIGGVLFVAGWFLVAIAAMKA
ncbi:DUF423 domain-containing protein [Bacillus sp. FJAT-45350]|uniref:DUF423 domain-containing protein n=1 Tax=Bacillus sp. FJAT-45350 TaxID=2011014 RepID=UPI000BB8E57F|nr:DUF423 domain-containing protein [Bacillus sp. FJAT-45350]